MSRMDGLECRACHVDSALQGEAHQGRTWDSFVSVSLITRTALASKFLTYTVVPLSVRRQTGDSTLLVMVDGQAQAIAARYQRVGSCSCSPLQRSLLPSGYLLSKQIASQS
jgi:hypothetical protein